MPRRTVDLDGVVWVVALSGRTTPYGRDEVGLTFTRGTGPDREVRVSRLSPRGSKAPDEALAELGEAALRDLLRRSQPAWTAPETGYGR